MKYNALAHLRYLDAARPGRGADAARAHLRGHGRVAKPDSLAQLRAAGLLRGAPVDPSGTPFVYDRGGEGLHRPQVRALEAAGAGRETMRWAVAVGAAVMTLTWAAGKTTCLALAGSAQMGARRRHPLPSTPGGSTA